jgi:hypothetical protein
MDEFVNQYNPLGHKGIYRDFSDALWPTTLKLLSINKRPCPWVFSDIENMIYFCTNLFGLKECPDGVLLEALMDYIGYEKVNDKLVLNWELVYTDLIRK